MTRKDNGLQERTPFSHWITDVLDDSKNYDVENLDFIRFHYRDGWFVTIEEKRFGAESRPAQMDTHNIVAQLLAIASGSKVKTWRGVRPIYYKGHYVVSFEKTTPDDSQWVKINGKKYTSPNKAVMFLLKEGDLFAEPPTPLDEQVAREAAKVREWLK